MHPPSDRTSRPREEYRRELGLTSTQPSERHDMDYHLQLKARAGWRVCLRTVCPTGQMIDDMF